MRSGACEAKAVYGLRREVRKAKRPSLRSSAKARALLGWSALNLANKGPVSETTIRTFEMGKIGPKPAKVSAIRRTFEAAGVEFDDKGHGVRTREGE
jgi:ribosome-binding protein aMBF1 (putative translation factor)